jgi:hypothetical protein
MKKTISIILAIIALNMMAQAQESPEIWMSYDLMPKKEWSNNLRQQRKKRTRNLIILRKLPFLLSNIWMVKIKANTKE